MKTTSRHGTGRKLLVAMLAGALVLPVSTADAWWGPGGPMAWGWDPQEAYLHEYGYDHPYGPTLGDIRRMQRDNWRAFMGYPVYIDNVGPRGPSYADVTRQYRRKLRNTWGYPY
jgi:hypothetical protein